MRAILRNHVNPGSFCVAATCILAVVVVFAISAYMTNPNNFGYDWILFIPLAMPWYRLHTRLPLLATIAN